MKICRNSLLVAPILFLNSLDLLYLIAFKVGAPVAEVYLITAGLSMILVMFNLGRYTKRELKIFLFLSGYLFIKLTQGLLEADEPLYSIVVFMSFLFIIRFVQFSLKISKDELLYFIKSIFYLTIILYLMVDLLSIILMGKSQHVVLSNIAPFLLLTALVLSKSSERNKWAPILFVSCYLLWVCISIRYFTIDQRYQVKAFSLLTLLVMSYFGAIFFSYIFELFKFKKLANIDIAVSMSFLLIFLFASSLMTLYLFGGEINNIRGSSLGLRGQVALIMLNDVFDNGSFIVSIFGYGLGSSMKEFHVIFGDYDLFLRSHSGFLSLVYEHGLLSIFIYIFSIIFISFPFGYEFTGDKSDRVVLFFLLVTLVVFWSILNTIYLISISVPNYGHQTQILSVLLLAIYLNRSIFNDKSPLLSRF